MTRSPSARRWLTGLAAGCLLAFTTMQANADAGALKARHGDWRRADCNLPRSMQLGLCVMRAGRPTWTTVRSPIFTSQSAQRKRPHSSNSGPPLLPGLITAVCWMTLASPTSLEFCTMRATVPTE